VSPGPAATPTARGFLFLNSMEAKPKAVVQAVFNHEREGYHFMHDLGNVALSFFVPKTEDHYGEFEIRFDSHLDPEIWEDQRELTEEETQWLKRALHNSAHSLLGMLEAWK